MARWIFGLCVAWLFAVTALHIQVPSDVGPGSIPPHLEESSPNDGTSEEALVEAVGVLEAAYALPAARSVVTKVCAFEEKCTPGAFVCVLTRSYCPEEIFENGQRTCLQPQQICTLRSTTERELPTCKKEFICRNKIVHPPVASPPPKASPVEGVPPLIMQPDIAFKKWNRLWRDHIRKRPVIALLQQRCETIKGSCAKIACDKPDYHQSEACVHHKELVQECRAEMLNCHGNAECLVSTRDTAKCTAFRSAHEKCRDCKHCRHLAHKVCQRYTFTTRRVACSLVNYYCETQRIHCTLADKCTKDLEERRKSYVAALNDRQLQRKTACVAKFKGCKGDAACQEYVRWTKDCVRFRRSNLKYQCEVSHDKCHSLDTPVEAAAACHFVRTKCPGARTECMLSTGCRGRSCFSSTDPSCKRLTKEHEETTCATLQYGCSIESDQHACEGYRRADCGNPVSRKRMRESLYTESEDEQSCLRARWMCRFGASHGACQTLASNMCYRQQVSSQRIELKENLEKAEEEHATVAKACTAARAHCTFDNHHIDENCMSAAVNTEGCAALEKATWRFRCAQFAMSCFVSHKDCDQRHRCEEGKPLSEASSVPAFRKSAGTLKTQPTMFDHRGAGPESRPVSEVDQIRLNLEKLESAEKHFKTLCRDAYKQCHHEDCRKHIRQMSHDCRRFKFYKARNMCETHHLACKEHQAESDHGSHADHKDCDQWKQCEHAASRRVYRHKYHFYIGLSRSHSESCKSQLEACRQDHACKERASSQGGCKRFHYYRTRAQCTWLEYSEKFHPSGNATDNRLKRNDCLFGDGLHIVLTDEEKLQGQLRSSLLLSCHARSKDCHDHQCIAAAESSKYCVRYHAAERQWVCAQNELKCEFGESPEVQANSCLSMASSCRGDGSDVDGEHEEETMVALRP